MEGSLKNSNSLPRSNNVDESETAAVDRKWVALTVYQPVDVVTKTVEVPVIKTVEKIVPKTIIQEKIIHVPKNVAHIVEKIVEVPEVKYIEKVVEVPHIHYKNKYVPKIEIVEKIVERQKIIEKWHDKIVEVPQIKEVIRFKEIEEAEEVIKYIPKNFQHIDWEAEYSKYIQQNEGRASGMNNSEYINQMNAYNAHNAKSYDVNAFNRSLNYENLNRNLNENVHNAEFSQVNYSNQHNTGIFSNQHRFIPASNLNVRPSLHIKRLPSEEAKPVGCFRSSCR